ncbi:MAG: peptidase domain-containing ABC transporter [Halanaerobiales bacterium]|nr:peptidase domain-containing ABC transporter [Halanaerobiales bacterium]
MQKIIRKIYLYYLKIFKRKLFVKQKDHSDCGTACLTTIANIYNKSYPISILREFSGTDQMGTSAYGLIKTAENIGFSAKGVKADIDDLNQSLKTPFIAHVIRENISHYLIVYKIYKKQLVIFDPDKGLLLLDKTDFKQIWTNILLLFKNNKHPNLEYQTVSKNEFIFDSMKGNKELIGKIFIVSIFYTLFGIIGSFYFKYLIDYILINGLVKTLHILSIAVIIIAVFKVMMDAFRNHLTLYLSQQIDIKLIMDYIEHILSLPISFYEKREVGEILSRINDSGKIRDALSSATISILIDSLLIIGGGFVLYFQSSFLFKIALILIPFYIVLVLVFANRHNKIRKEEMEKGADLQTTLVETIDGINTIKSLNVQNYSYLINEDRFLNFVEKVFKASFLKNVQNSIDNLLAALGETIILWTGGYQVIKGNLTIGQLITFNALLVYFYKPLQNLVKLQPKIQNALVALERLKEIMELKPERKSNNSIVNKKIKGNIKFQNVEFIYNMKDKVLKGISFKIKQGQKVAFVGKSGSGKTTIIKLLLKFYDINKGRIVIDNNSIKDIKTTALREKIGYVPQDIFLFNKTIYENIRMDNKKYDKKDVIAAAKKAKIHNYINTLSNRYQTKITEKGRNLSGGQRQRIAIARVLLKDPDLIIFDEATNNLDLFTEKEIYKMIDKLFENRTTIIISHKFKTIKKCDQIICLKKGKIIEKGTHQKLINNNDYYSKIWEEQI